MTRTAPTRFALALALALAAAGARAEPWHYVIDEARLDQQGNFCDSAEDVAEVARVFERYGPRPGYAALSYVETCRLAVESFTPREIVRRVVISAGKPDEYAVHFVRVEMAGGAMRFLVTTRDVRAPGR